MPTAKSANTLIFGCGYLGLSVAEKLNLRPQESGTGVWGVTRSETKAARLRSLGILPILADWTDRRTLCRLPEVEQILVAVSYDSRSRHDRYESQVGGLRNLLQVTSPEAKLCYISTTGVYHQADGGWVDETSPCRPTQQGGKAHLAAEQLLHRIRPNSPWTILRLSGIYGPGRIPRIADLLSGRPVASPQRGYLNLIHVDDAADAAIGAWTNSQRRIYLVSDDRPVLRGQFYREVARQFGAPEVQFVDPPSDAPVRMRSDSNKRVWNRRMKRDLLPSLRYPTFREGVAAIVGHSSRVAERTRG